jgi:hypothetical protein
MCHIMGRLAHIPQILEKLGSSTLLARSVMARTRGPRRTEGSCRGATKIGMLHPTITEPKGETGMLVVLFGMCKLANHPGVNELLNKSTIPRSHAGKHRPLQLAEDEVTHINLPLTTRLAPIQEVDMIATNVRSVPLLTNQILTEKLGQGIEGVVHARESGRFCHMVRGGIAEGNVAHPLGYLGVNFVSSVIYYIVPNSIIEISIGAITLLRASHPSHIAVIIKVDGAVELANDIGVVVMLEGCNLKNTELL